MQRLEVSGAIRPIYGSLGVKRLMSFIVLFITHSKAEMLSIHLNDFLVMLQSTQVTWSSRKKCWLIALS